MRERLGRAKTSKQGVKTVEGELGEYKGRNLGDWKMSNWVSESVGIGGSERVGIGGSERVGGMGPT